MQCKATINNESGIDLDELIQLANEFLPYAESTMGFSEPVAVSLMSDEENSLNPLGKTAYYDPTESAISIFVDGRHPKDILRSLSHELVHHTQNCNGMFDDLGAFGPGYAQQNDHLREMEREAYELGNLCFRDWEDEYKQKQQWSLNEGALEDLMSKWAGKSPIGVNPSSVGYKYSLDGLNIDEKSQKHFTETEPGPHWDRRPVAGERKENEEAAGEETEESSSSGRRLPNTAQGWTQWIFLHSGKDDLKKAFYSALYEDDLSLDTKMNIYRKYSETINKKGYVEYLKELKKKL